MANGKNIIVLGMLLTGETKKTRKKKICIFSMLYSVVFICFICLPILSLATVTVRVQNECCFHISDSTMLSVEGNIILNSPIQDDGIVIIKGLKAAGKKMCIPVIISYNNYINNLHIESGIVCLGSDLYLVNQMNARERQQVILNGYNIFMNYPIDNLISNLVLQFSIVAISGLAPIPWSIFNICRYNQTTVSHIFQSTAGNVGYIVSQLTIIPLTSIKRIPKKSLYNYQELTLPIPVPPPP